MAGPDTETMIACPACGQEITIPLALAMTSTTEGVVTLDTSGVRAHIAEHQAAEAEAEPKAVTGEYECPAHTDRKE